MQFCKNFADTGGFVGKFGKSRFHDLNHRKQINQTITYTILHTKFVLEKITVGNYFKLCEVGINK